MIFICPRPGKWSGIYQRLHRAWEAEGAIGAPPPVPLILAGWVYTNDLEKKARWEATVAWAMGHALSHLIPPLSAAERHEVVRPSDYAIGPLGGPMYLEWDYTVKDRPPDDEAAKAIEVLKAKWMSVAGPELGDVTRPLRFTGAKLRRLLVEARRACAPPWGSWTRLANGEGRRSFTRFRRAVNEAIAPLHVDHIDFELCQDDTGDSPSSAPKTGKA